jgi:indole-3-glycerol phosphate synthase/phosphoribosylanthranilate isomerase
MWRQAMADVLARIVARKREEVAARLSGPVAAEPTARSLKTALLRHGARFIMEVKRKSPSGHVSEVTPEAAVAAYAPVADAISVLTDGADFGGSLGDLAKDFIVDPAQVSEARAAGADAVLVMMSVLGDAGAAAVMAEAKRFNMDAIVEIHGEEELARALALNAEIVGINNRDLKTLKIDLAVTERLAPMIPSDTVAISESGISTRADVHRLAPLVDGFLVGSALMAAPDVGQAARALVHGRVKLCGITRRDDVALAAASGATHVGLIMVPGTPRAITTDQARPLAEAIRQAGMKAVGVFRDADIDTIVELPLDAVQLHGSESQDVIDRLRDRLPATTEIWAAGEASACRRRSDRTLFDSGSGGTGQPFDWSLIAGREALPTAFLAGGITPANAAAAAQVGGYGLDVGSGVEASPGIKDPAKVAALFAALRPASRTDR